jgi:isoleucyl-tRNA synthetase
VVSGDALAVFQVRPNLPVLGPKYGQQVRNIREALAASDPQAIAARVRAGKAVTVGEFTLEPDEVLVSVEDRPGLAVAMEGVGGLVVAVDTAMTQELADEGTARELVHRLQNMRRDGGLKIDDRITAYVFGADDRMRLVLEQHGDYIRQETLSIKLLLELPSEGAHAQEQTVEGVRLTLGVESA